MKRLLIRADDLGYSQGVNCGIAATVAAGLVRSVGVMTNMPDAVHGLGLLAGLGMTLAVQSSSATIAVLQQVAARPGPDGGCLLGRCGGRSRSLLGVRTSAPPSRRCWHR